MRTIVIGGAGFIGSHLVERAARIGHVTVYDNLSVGTRQNLGSLVDQGRVTLVQGDALDLDSLEKAAAGHDTLVHLAANPEARWGLERPRLDLEQGTIATWNALEAARRCGIPTFVFASSGTVYGDVDSVCAETDLGCLPISLYGASKLAGEAMISSYVECFGLQAVIFRFGNVIGPRATHGVILDLCRRLRHNPDLLDVRGDGAQAKPYLHVTECVTGILYGLDHGQRPIGIYNLTPPDTVSVRRIAELCVAASPNPRATIVYDGGRQGWRGDVPRSRLCPDRLAALGYRVSLTSLQAVERAVSEIAREVFVG